MDKERQNKTLTLSELLNKTVNLNKTVYSEVLKHSTVFSFWDKIVGAQLSKLSKPYKIKNSKLYITTKSSAVSQQIIFIKKKVLDKTNSFSKPLGIEISDIVLNYKNYEEITNPKKIPPDEEIIYIKDSELENIKLPKEIMENIKSSVDKISFINNSQKEVLTGKILNNYKAKILRNNLNK